MIKVKSVDDVINFSNMLDETLSRAKLPRLTGKQQAVIRGLLAGLIDTGNAPEVARRLQKEVTDGTAAKDWPAWAAEAVITMARLEGA